MEAHEIHEFAEQMKESGEAKESLTTISLAISILAVIVAMVSVAGHRAHTEAILMQSRAADQWNEYQAQKIRMDNLSVVVDQMNLQPTLSAAATIKLKQYETHIEKWHADLAREQQIAENYEHEVEHAEKRAARYDLGEALLQIGVVLCSITLFTRTRAYFLMGLTLGGLGILVAVSALFVH